MGLLLSGFVSDYVFCMKCESAYTCVCYVRDRFNIRSYVRFKDDIHVIIGGTSESRAEWLRQFKSLAHPFVIKVEGITVDAMNVLDLCMYRGKRWQKTNVLDVKPFFKITNLGIPLDSTSSHRSSVHSTWPISRHNTFARRTTKCP